MSKDVVLMTVKFPGFPPESMDSIRDPWYRMSICMNLQSSRHRPRTAFLRYGRGIMSSTLLLGRGQLEASRRARARELQGYRDDKQRAPASGRKRLAGGSYHTAAL